MKRFTVTLAFLTATLVLAPLAPGIPSVSAQQEEELEPHPATQDPEHRVTMEDIERWEEELSNWGRWGPNDQKGTLNLITPEKTVQATRLVEDGVTVSLQHFVNESDAIDSQTFSPTNHYMTAVDEDTGEVLFALDAIEFGLHDGQLSHMDALCHYYTMRDGERVIFNGYPQNLDQQGCKDLAIDKMGPGYVTRAILVDMPLLRGVDWLEPSTPIFVEDLEEWLDFAGLEVRPGDVLLVRTGRWEKRAQEGPWAYGEKGAGLHASVLPWLHEHGVAALVGDAVNDVQPSGVEGLGRPIHQLTQVNIGLPLVDNGYLRDVAEEAEERERWEFMISWQLNAVPGGTASPFNAIATF